MGVAVARVIAVGMGDHGTLDRPPRVDVEITGRTVEALGALDHQTRELMQELLLGIWEAEQKTVLFVTHDIDEAVFMGTRIVVMSARPGRIKLDRVVPIAHPRHYSVKTTPAFAELKARLTEEIRGEALRAVEMGA